MDSNFTLKNFYLDNRRTSLRLDNESYIALTSICEDHNIQLDELMEMLEQERENFNVQMSRTAYLRVFIIHYLSHQLDVKGNQGKIPSNLKTKKQALEYLRGLTIPPKM